MTRTALFDAIREFMPDKRFTQPMVAKIDELADLAGMPMLDAAPKPVKPSTPTIPDDYWPLLAKIESANNPMAKAGTSSASGLYQFIKSTWIGEGGKWGADMSKPFGGLTPSREEQTERARTFTQKNAVALLRAGIPINKASLYAAHFAGVGMAVRLIGANVKESAEVLAGPAATSANPTILRGKTVGDFLSWLHKKTGDWAR